MVLRPMAAGLELTSKVVFETYNEFSPVQFDKSPETLEETYTNEHSVNYDRTLNRFDGDRIP